MKKSNIIYGLAVFAPAVGMAACSIALFVMYLLAGEISAKNMTLLYFALGQFVLILATAGLSLAVHVSKREKSTFRICMMCLQALAVAVWCTIIFVLGAGVIFVTEQVWTAWIFWAIELVILIGFVYSSFYTTRIKIKGVPYEKK